jgi:hypothetical protein
MTADPIGKEQRLVEFPLAQPLGMQRDGDDQIDFIEWRKSVDHETGQRRSQRDFASVFEQANGILQRRPIRIERPRFGIGGGPFAARLADMLRTIGRGEGRDERAVATSAP